MQPERWRRVEELYHAAMKQEEGQRAAFLSRSCAGDQPLRAEVESLITYALQTGRIIDQPAMEVVAAAMAEDLRAQDGNNADKMSVADVAEYRIGEKKFMSGAMLGDYEVKSLLGAGSMGEVYRACDSRLGRDVAIKVLPFFLSADSDRPRRFEQEARAAAALNHPNILAVFQMGTYDGAPYLVSELLEGETLRESIKRGRLSVRKAIDYGVQIAHGLAAAHEKGITHRDLKPENLFVTKDGRVKILDFGLAKLTQPQPSSEHSAPTSTEGTEPGVVLGTVGYMSPEQVRGQPADHRSDIFALGATLYEMLAGKRAFQKPTTAETMSAILNEDPAAISQVTEDISPALQRLVHRCLEKNPERRFQSAADLAFALEALSDFGPARWETAAKTGTRAGTLTPGVEEIEDPGAQKEPSAKSAKRARRWQIRLLSGGAIAATAFLLWWYTPLPPPQVTRIDHLTTTARIDTPVKLVSDGARLYYMERDGDHWNLMETAVSGGEGQRVETGATSALAMDVSPDFSELLIGSFERRGEPNRLWTIPAQGGAPMRLGDATATDAVFSPDGKQIAYLSGSNLWMMDANGSNSHLLAALPGAPSWLAWSPDGKALRFTLTRGHGTSIVEIESDGSNLHELLPNWTPPAVECCGSWTSDGRYFVFTSTRGGRSNLWALREKGSWWRRSARGPFQLTFGPDRPWGGTPGRDGRQIFFYNGAWREELKRLDLATRQFYNVGPNSGRMHVNFSRDGNWIAYIDTEHGGLYRSRLDGTERVELTGHRESVSFPRWSPDGKWILFGGTTPSGMNTSYLIPATGGKRETLLESQTEMRDADWSSDGRKIVLAHALGPKDSDGRELQIVDFATRQMEAMPDSQNLAMSRWSYDGRFIAATEDDQSQLKLWDVTRRQWRVITRGKALGISVWSPDSRYLYFQDLLGKDEEVWRYNIRLERIEPVMEFSEFLRSGVGRCALVGMTPDGSPVIAFNRGSYDLFTASVTLP
jgi:eukaryotic-like serine/threonine-protein kinase